MLDKSIPYKSLVMRRPPEALPAERPLPAGFSFRRFQPGDEAHWARLETAVAEFASERDARAYFAERFLPYEALLRARCCFVCAPDGLPVSTAMAWEEGGVRLLHWVSTLPAFQRRGLGRAVVLHALHSYPPEASPSPIWLGTQTWSHDAILLYDALGFCLVRAGTHPAAHSPNCFAEGMEVLRTVYPPEVFARLLARSLPA
ncbi:MAG: GNAT family N-acetyltransferase [Candidatus Spyradocola sp.]|jgi:GNAT superfamily N-acetyltransferase